MLIEFNAIRKPSAKVAERDLKIGRLSPDDTIGFPFTTDESIAQRTLQNVFVPKILSVKC